MAKLAADTPLLSLEKEVDSFKKEVYSCLEFLLVISFKFLF
jgi:hypothetical protein